MQVQLLVDAEVRVNAELAAACGLVIAAADEIGIGDQTPNGRERLEELEHRPRIEEVEELARRSVALLRQDLPLVQAGLPHFEDAVRLQGLAREMLQRESRHRIRQELVDDKVRER